MRDEDYQAEQIGAYGAGEQPAVAARMTPHLRMTQVGAGLGAVAVALAIAAIVVFPRFSSDSGLEWAVIGGGCALAMLGICVVQLLAWGQAMEWWRGRRTGPPAGLARTSWWLHAGSYLVALVALYACISGSAAAGWSATAATLLALTLLFLLGAQVLGAVQYVRPSGPPGTVPTHLRNLLARERARQAAAAAIVERDSPTTDHLPPRG